MRQLLVGALVGYLAAFITMASPDCGSSRAGRRPQHCSDNHRARSRWAATSACRSPRAYAAGIRPPLYWCTASTAASRRGTRILPKLHEAGLPALALDQRGHGESPLGDPETFSTEALARDVIHAVEVQHGVQRPWILVGHSMGGRVAMAVAAISAKEAPDRLAAVVVEDMDCRNREKWGPQPQESEEIEEFDREFASEKEAVAALESTTTPTASRAGSGRGSGRSPAVATGAT